MMCSSDCNAAAKQSMGAEESSECYLNPLDPVVDQCLKRWKKAMCCLAVVCIVATTIQLIEYQFIYEHFSHRTAPHYYKGNVFYVSIVSYIAAAMTFIRCFDMNYIRRLDEVKLAPPFEKTALAALFGNLLLGLMIVYDVLKY